MYLKIITQSHFMQELGCKETGEVAFTRGRKYLKMIYEKIGINLVGVSYNAYVKKGGRLRDYAKLYTRHFYKM